MQFQTPVILVCIYDLSPIDYMNKQMVSSLFSPYGHIVRLLVFEKTETFKALLEYDSISSAQLAYKALDRFKVYEDHGRIRIFSSDLREIRPKYTNTTTINNKKDYPNDLNEEELFESINGYYSSCHDDAATESSLPETTTSLPEVSPVIQILGIDPKEVDCQMLQNIFCCYGSILKIIFVPTRAVALIQYENHESAKVAITYLDHMIFMGKPIRIKFSKYKELTIRCDQSEKYRDYLVVRDGNSYPSTPPVPSPFVEISFRGPPFFTIIQYKQQLETLDNIKVRSIRRSNFPNSFIFELQSIEESLIAISSYHKINSNEISQVCFYSASESLFNLDIVHCMFFNPPSFYYQQ